MEQRNTISQILMKYGKKPLVGFADADFSTPYYSEDDMDDKDWLEIFSEFEEVVIMSTNTAYDDILMIANELFGEYDDELFIEDDYDEDYEEVLIMKQKPNLKIGIDTIITANKTKEELLKCIIPEDMRYTHDIEFCANTVVLDTPQEAIGEIVKAITAKSLETGVKSLFLLPDNKDRKE